MDKSKAVDKTILVNMNNKLVHRGPDDEGYYINENIGLAVRRLSIIDIKRGHQPIYNEDRSICVVCNGEIYNFLELREVLEKQGHNFYTKSDTEVIIHLYEEYGEDFVHKLRGMFAICIWDEKQKKIILIRDRLGIKPLFYMFKNGTLLFASELKALLQYPKIQKEISLKALSDYLSLLYIPSPHTIFKNIHKLPPAHVLILKDNDINIYSYWDISYVKKKIYDEDYYGQRLKELLSESVKMHLVSEVPLGAFLSGGMDSSTVVALMSEVANESVKTFSVGFDVSDFNELRYAKLVAKRFNTHHHEINLTADIVNLLPKIVAQFDEPFADSSAIPTYLISQFAKKYVTVCLAGDGGDELFAGYDWTRRQRFIDYYNRIPKILRRSLEFCFLDKDYSPDRKGKLFDKIKRFLYDANIDPFKSYLRRFSCFTEDMKSKLFNEQTSQRLNNYKSYSEIEPYFLKVEIKELMEKLLYIDSKVYLPDDGLCKVDRMSMLHSLEVRVPFLDHVFVEFAAAIPFKYKMKGLISKYIVKKTMKDLLPNEITKQRKQGFSIPINNWFRGELNNISTRILLDNGAKIKEFLNQEFIRWILDEHIQGRQDFGPQIYALLVLELWLKLNSKQEIQVSSLKEFL